LQLSAAHWWSQYEKPPTLALVAREGIKQDGGALSMIVPLAAAIRPDQGNS
jgi:hypothetical protein